MIRSLAAACGLVLCASAWGLDAQQCETGSFEARSAEARVALSGPDAARSIQQQSELFLWLRESQGPRPAPALVIPLSERDRADLGLVDCDRCETPGADSRRKLVGVVKLVDHDVDFGSLEPERAQSGKTFAGGRLTRNTDGLSWNFTIESPDATALRMSFRNVSLPDDAALFVYNDHGDAFGPYVGDLFGRGEWWSHTVTGDSITLAVQFFGEPTRQDLAQTRFHLSEIVHLGPDFQVAARIRPEVRGGNGHCSYNEPCTEDAQCYGSNDFAHIDDARMAAGHMLFTSGPWAYVCSGGLLADTAGSEVPYFLTANHCIRRKREASSLEAYFRYMTASCGAICPHRSNFPRTLGSSILSTNSSGDYTLLLLDQQPPSGSVFLGWTSAPVANSNNTSLYRISHPAGAPQAFSTHHVDTARPTCNSWPRGPWIYSSDVIGATEGGSSGSPVMNAAGQVVGTLSGACGFNVNNPCDANSNATVDGAFAHFFGAIEQWLDPDGSGEPDPGDPDPGDPDPGDPDPGDPGVMSVASIELSERARGPWRNGEAMVTIRDADGTAVGGASVSGNFSGDVSGSPSATTGSNGQVLLESNRVRQNSISFNFCVSNVSHPDFDWDGVEVCASL